MSREIDFRQLVLAADPGHGKSSRRVPEYEFSAPSRARVLAAHDSEDDAEFSRDVRVFYANGKTPGGAYAPQPETNNGINWYGTKVTWNGIPLTWDGE
jgi:hypothetical protein